MKPKQTTALPSGVHVGAGAHPVAAAYAARLQNKKLQKTNNPVGGPPISIPRLDAPHATGMTMEQQAQAQRGGAPPAPAHSPSIVEPARAAAGGGGGPTPALSLTPADILPDEARADSGFIEGHGSMYAVSQPRLAMKYGVIRNGQFIPPQQLRPQQGGLRPETLQGLQTLQELQAQQSGNSVPGLHPTEQAAEQSVGDHAKAAARSANMPGDSSEKPLTAEQKKNLDAVKNLDEFDLDSFRQMMMKDLLNNDQQKNIIEGRLQPLKLDDMILHNRVTQRIPIVPGVFEPTLQSLTGEEDLALKRLIMEEANSVEVTDRYLLDKYSLMSVAVSLKEINGKPIGSHVGADGGFDDDAFKQKFNRIIKLPLHMLASIGINVFWFESRVRKLFVAEKVGNG